MLSVNLIIGDARFLTLPELWHTGSFFRRNEPDDHQSSLVSGHASLEKRMGLSSELRYCQPVFDDRVWRVTLTYTASMWPK